MVIVYLMSLEGHDVLVLVRVGLVVVVLGDDVTHVTTSIDGSNAETLTIREQRDACQTTELTQRGGRVVEVLQHLQLVQIDQ